MRHVITVFLAGALAAGCAWSAPEAQRAKAIEDVEPEVSREVAAALARKAADTGVAASPEAALLAACPDPFQLELLRRSVDGEERSYLYRARCPAPLLVSATYGKAAAIKRLTVVRE